MLRSSRHIHEGGIGLIPISEIKAYLDLHEVQDVDDRELWVKMILALDSAYAEHVNAKLNRQRDVARNRAAAQRKGGRRG